MLPAVRDAMLAQFEADQKTLVPFLVASQNLHQLNQHASLLNKLQNTQPDVAAIIKNRWAEYCKSQATGAVGQPVPSAA